MQDLMPETRLFLTAISRNLDELLGKCSMLELLELNFETYAIYSATFGELKKRILVDAYSEQRLIEQSWTLMKQRAEFTGY